VLGDVFTERRGARHLALKYVCYKEKQACFIASCIQRTFVAQGQGDAVSHTDSNSTQLEAQQTAASPLPLQAAPFFTFRRGGGRGVE